MSIPSKCWRHAGLAVRSRDGAVPAIAPVGVLPRRARAGYRTLVSAAVILAAGSAAAEPPAYEIIDLGTLGGGSSVALGINNNGQVVGGADTFDGRRHPFLWTDGAMIDLGTLAPSTQAEAWDINNQGQVVGVLGIGAGGFLWEDGKMINIGHLSGPTGTTSALAINDAGQVVGISGVSVGVRHAFIWEHGVMTDLGTLGGSRSVAWDINQAGQIAGESFTDGSPGGAFLWTDGVMENLGTLGGGGSEALGLNDHAVVVGSSSRADGSVGAFMWDSGEMTDLGALLGFGRSRASAINNCGQILLDPYFIYDSVDDVLLNVPDLIPPDSGWFDLSVRDMNDAGQLVGAGTFNGARRAFLMLPSGSDEDGDGFHGCLDECPGVDDSIFAPECRDAIPTLSSWGLIVLVISFLVVAKIYFGCPTTSER